MSDHNQARHTITRRNLIRTAIGSLITLPAVGGVGLFSMERVAYAAGIQEQAGESFTNEELAKITVITRTEVSIVVVDMAKHKGALDPSKEVTDKSAFVAGAKVSLYSRYNKTALEGTSDAEGKVIFDIRELAENPDYKPLDKLDTYAFNGSIEVSLDGYRTFKTALVRLQGTDVIVAPTRSISPNDSSAYPHMVSYNEWDVLYFNNQFCTSTGNNEDKTLELEGRGFGDAEATVVLREQGTSTELMSTTAQPSGGVLKASFTHKFSLLGGEGAFEVGKSYEIMVVQGEVVYVWPLQLTMVEGVIDEAIDTTLDFKPFAFKNGAGPNLAITWPDSIPFIGGSKTDIMAPFNSTVSAYFDPFGMLQLTASFPLYGCKWDNGKDNPKGWQQWPFGTISEQFDKYEKTISESWNKTWKSAGDKGTFRQTDFFLKFQMMIYFQMMAALRWDDPKHVMRGAAAYQVNLTLDFTLTEQFWFGPVPVLITINIPFTATAAFTMGIHTEPTDPGESLKKQFFDIDNWTKAPSDDNITISLNFGPSLSIGVGIRGIASASLKGKFTITLSIILPTDTDNPAFRGKPLPHCLSGWQAGVYVVLQFFFASQTWTWLETKYHSWFDNWDGKTTPAEDPKYMGASAEAEAGPSIAEFIGGMRLVTSAMMGKISEADGEVTSEAAMPIGAEADGADAEAADDVLKITLRDIWNRARERALAKELDKVGAEIPHRFYRFERAELAQQAAKATPTKSEGIQTAEDDGIESVAATAPVGVEAAGEAAQGQEPGIVEVAGIAAEAEGAPTVEGASPASVSVEATPSSEGDNPAGAVAMAAPAAATAGESKRGTSSETTSDGTPTVAEATEAEQGTAVTAEADQDASERNFSLYWHKGSSVSYADWVATPQAGAPPRAHTAAEVVREQVVAEAEGGFLPDPGVGYVMTAGGVRPSSDVVIAESIYGDPQVKVLDIRQSVSTGTDIRATCAFRIGAVEVPGVGLRSRIIMTVLDASEGFSLVAGTSRVIDFDIFDADVTHNELFDYEFGLDFSSIEAAAGSVEASIDQVEIVVVSGRRANEDDTPVAVAATDLYITYLQFYAQDLLGEDYANAQYLQLTIPASAVVNPTGTGDNLVHNVSNITCVSATTDDSDVSSLLVTFLDRAAQTPEQVFSDDPNTVTVRPRFLLFRSDAINVDVVVPDSSALDELLGRLNRNDPTALRLTLSPKIGGFYTLTVQGQTKTCLYLLDFDPDQAVFTTARQCPMLDSTIELVPWPQQDCFLTSFASAEYRATEEFLQGNPSTWDRSKWVLQRAWWKPTGSPQDTYILGFEEIGPDSFNFSRFALNSSGSFIFWQDGRSGSDEYFYDVDGNYTVQGEDNPVYQIKACRVRNNADGSLHFSDPFVAADVPHDMDSLEAVSTHDRYAPFEVLSTELVDTGETMTDVTGNTVPLYYAANLWYTSVPNLQFATVVASDCTLPAVSAGGEAKFDVTIRNDGNSFLSGCTLQMYVHDLEVTGENINKLEPVLDADGNYIDKGVSPVGDAFELAFNADTLLVSPYDKADDQGNFLHEEPDFALPPGKRSVYRVTVPIPEDWAGVKFVSFNATNPQMAEGGGLAAEADDEPVFQSYSVEPGTYPAVEDRVTPKQSRSQRFMLSLPVDNPTSSVVTYSDAPVTVITNNAGTSGQSSGASNVARYATPSTADSTSSILPVGLGLAGAALAAYGKRRQENERGEEERSE